jgi:hypothetical protein
MKKTDGREKNLRGCEQTKGSSSRANRWRATIRPIRELGEERTSSNVAVASNKRFYVDSHVGKAHRVSMDVTGRARLSKAGEVNFKMTLRIAGLAPFAPGFELRPYRPPRKQRRD